MNEFTGTYLVQMGVFYLFTIAIETPVLMVGLSRRHPMRNRVFAGIWLTACTYPILWLVLPKLINPATNRVLYLAVGETFVHFGECLLFWLAFGGAQPRTRGAFWQDMVVVFLANLASFGAGSLVGKEFWEWISEIME